VENGGEKFRGSERFCVKASKIILFFPPKLPCKNLAGLSTQKSG
jgi:hypothetical protein